MKKKCRFCQSVSDYQFFIVALALGVLYFVFWV